MLGGDPLELRSEAFVELDHVHRRRALRQLGGQRPLATADLEHDVVRPGTRLADDRGEKVGVGEKVLPQPHHEKTRAALASTAASSSA